MITKCEDCNNQVRVTLVGYGSSYMAEIDCKKCGLSYDTNLSDEDIASLKTEPYCGDHLVPLGQCSCKP